MSDQIEKGDVVRQYNTPARVTWCDATVTFVHENGALDVDIDGEAYGWNANMCEIVCKAADRASSADQIAPSSGAAMNWGTWFAEMGIQIGAIIFGAAMLAGGVAIYTHLVPN